MTKYKVEAGTRKLTSSFAKIKQRFTNQPSVNTKCCAFESTFFTASS